MTHHRSLSSKTTIQIKIISNIIESLVSRIWNVWRIQNMRVCMCHRGPAYRVHLKQNESFHYYKTSCFECVCVCVFYWWKKFILNYTAYLAVSKIKVIAHLNRQRAFSAAMEIHNAVLAATVRHIIHCENPLTSWICLIRCTQKKENSQTVKHNRRQNLIFLPPVTPANNLISMKTKTNPKMALLFSRFLSSA